MGRRREEEEREGEKGRRGDGEMEGRKCGKEVLALCLVERRSVVE